MKKTLFGSYNTPLKADGIIAVDMRDGDELMAVRHTSGDDDIIMVSRLGQAIRFHESDIRPTGRNTAGVIGMRLRAGDEVIAMDIARDDSDLFVITENGFGKRTLISEYPVQGRGGLGVRTITLTDRKGYLVGVRVVRENHEISLQSRDGMVIRMRADGIRRYGRADAGRHGHEHARGRRVAPSPAWSSARAAPPTRRSTRTEQDDGEFLSSDATGRVVCGPAPTGCEGRAGGGAGRRRPPPVRRGSSGRRAGRTPNMYTRCQRYCAVRGGAHAGL